MSSVVTSFICSEKILRSTLLILVLLEAICFPHETQFRSVHLFHSFFTNRLKRQNNLFPWGDGPSIHDGFELGKNRKQKSAVKQKLGSMIVKAKSAKQFKE